MTVQDGAETRRVQLRTSLRCNNNCIFCMERSPERSAENARADAEGKAFLTPEGLEGNLATLKNRDVSLMFTSGEPTLNPQLPELVKRARQAGFGEICIQTNGRRLGYLDYATHLVRQGVTEFSISIHGSCSLIHNAMTRTPGSFDQTWKGLSNLLSLKRLFPKLRIGVTCTATKMNLNDLRPLMRKLFALQGLDHANLNPMILQGNGLRFKDRLLVRCSDIVAECARFEAEQSDRPADNRNKPGLAGIPACVGSGYQRAFEKLRLFEIEKSSLKVFPAERDIFHVKLPACADCVWSGSCIGIQPGYLERFGADEVRPVLTRTPREPEGEGEGEGAPGASHASGDLSSELELSRFIAREMRWYGGDRQYPPMETWKALDLSEVRRAWREAAGLLAARRSPEKMLGLYLELPGALLQGRQAHSRGLQEADRYLACLEAEARLIALPPALPLSTVYIGSNGLGMLSRMTPRQVENLFKMIRHHFDLRSCLQITVEMDPFQAADDHLKILHDCGVHRVSVRMPGVKDEGGARRIRRSLADFAQSARACGIAFLDIDIVCGPAGFNGTTFKKTLDHVLRLRPDTIHLQQHWVRDKTGHVAVSEVDETARGECQRKVDEALARLSQGRTREGGNNLQLYYAHHRFCSVLGLGYGAVSHARARMRYIKSGSYEEYVEALRQSHFPMVRGCLLGSSEEMRSFVVTGLEELGHVGEASFRRIFRRSLEKVFSGELAFARRAGAVKADSDGFSVPPGFPGGGAVASKFFYSPEHREAFRRRYGAVSGGHIEESETMISGRNSPSAEGRRDA